MRIFAILIDKDSDIERIENRLLLNELLPFGNDSTLLLFHEEETAKAAIELSSKIIANRKVDTTLVQFKEDVKNKAAQINFALDYVVNNYRGSNNFAHFFTDNKIDVQKDMSCFMSEIEKMMHMLDYDCWFNTVLDECNYIFDKYDCRFSVAINDEKYKKVYDKTIRWTSHSNPNYFIVDIDNFKSLEEPGSNKLFDERFDIAMFYIIKYILLRKKNHLGFMNYYPTIPEEEGIFAKPEKNEPLVAKKEDEKNKNKQESPDKMKKEDEMFKQLKLDPTPNGNPEEVMDFMIEKLEKKL